MSVDCNLYLFYGTRMKDGVKYDDIPETLMLDRTKDNLAAIYDGMCGKDHFIGYIVDDLGTLDYDLETRKIDMSMEQNMQVSLLRNETFLQLTDNSVPCLYFVAHYS